MCGVDKEFTFQNFSNILYFRTDNEQKYPLMKTYISILRGINVSGQNLIKMNALKEAYTDLGLKNVNTYIQSGNVIFQSEEGELKQKISEQIQKRFGFEVPLIILSVDDLKQIVENSPYKDDVTKDISHLYVTVLSSKLVNPNIELAKAKQSPKEEFVVIENIVYLYCPNGYGKTKLTNVFWENLLKMKATTRNWKTINELLRIAENIK